MLLKMRIFFMSHDFYFGLKWNKNKRDSLNDSGGGLRIVQKLINRWRFFWTLSVQCIVFFRSNTDLCVRKTCSLGSTCVCWDIEQAPYRIHILFACNLIRWLKCKKVRAKINPKHSLDSSTNTTEVGMKI